jgi:hypothetical protein
VEEDVRLFKALNAKEEINLHLQSSYCMPSAFSLLPPQHLPPSLPNTFNAGAPAGGEGELRLSLERKGSAVLTMQTAYRNRGS